MNNFSGFVLGVPISGFDDDDVVMKLIMMMKKKEVSGI